jgi:HEAT repeat protein/TolA-binding protein
MIAAGLIYGSVSGAEAQKPPKVKAPPQIDSARVRSQTLRPMDDALEALRAGSDAWMHIPQLDFSDFDFQFDFSDLDIPQFDFDFDGLNMAWDGDAMDAARDAMEESRWQLEDLRDQFGSHQWEMDEALRNVDRDALRDQALEALNGVDSDAIRQQLEDASLQISSLDPMLLDNSLQMAQIAGMDALESLHDNWNFDGSGNGWTFGEGARGSHPSEMRPRPSWAPGDPADSLYRLARETLNRGNYRRASDLFGEIVQKYPASSYAPDALYWKAFALYRIGTTAELNAARQALDTQKSRYAEAYARSDGASLASRIQGALAAQGDEAAMRNVNSTASQAVTSCDKDDMAVRVEALNALSQIDPAAAVPLLKNILARQDECTVTLRRRAIFILGKQRDSSSAPVLANVVRTDPDASVRGDAILWLARVPGEQTVNILSDLLGASTDARVQASAIHALASSESPRARQVLRSFIERGDVSERMRIRAIGELDDRVHATPEDAAYLRALYPKLESERLRKATIGAIAHIGGAENESWLYTLARNADAPAEMRSEALSRVGRLNTTSVVELTNLYDQLATRDLREQLISIYARRKEQQATDKLLDIVRTGTDPRLRRMAISALTRKNDPRTTKLLLEIIDQ